MSAAVIILICIAAVLFLFFLTTLVCFLMAFYSPKRKESGQIDIPKGKIYEPYREAMTAWIMETRNTPSKEFCITSFDGLKLYAKYYECQKGAPIELMFHGYRGSAEKDLCGGMQRCFKLKHNAFIVEQRASGKSDGRVITFGINESKDCLSWLELINKEFGTQQKIILCGISMGAATVLTAAGEKLPDNVIGVLADCGFTSAKDIIIKVIYDMKLPAKLLYPFVKWGAKIYGGFDLESASPIKAMEKCSVPIIFFHGEDDAYVPCAMSEQNYNACVSSKKRIVTTKGAGHGLCYMLSKEDYITALQEFFG